MASTILVTLVLGVEVGLVVGVGLSIFLHLYATSRPHVAVVGQIPGTTHFRNVERHAVVTDPEIVSLRVDASLYFPTPGSSRIWSMKRSLQTLRSATSSSNAPA